MGEIYFAVGGTQSNYGILMHLDWFLVQNSLAIEKSAILKVTNQRYFTIFQ